MKTVPDMDKVPDADWASGAASCRCDFSYVPKIPDPYCESGAELVLRMMDEASAKAGDAQVITADAITVGDRLAEKPLRTLAALGYRVVYRIDAGEFETPFDPSYTAQLIAGFCQREQYDLIVMGMESFDEGSRLVPYYLAEHLGLPCITDAVSLSPAGEDRIRISFRLGDDLITETVKTPLVVTVGDVPSCLLRVPTLRQRNAAKGNAVQLVEPAKLDLPAPGHGAHRLIRLDTIDQSRQTQRFEGSAEEAARKILALCQERGISL